MDEPWETQSITKHELHLMRKIKTLLVSSLYPLPENIGTRMRTMNFARFFRNHGDVDLLYFRPDSRESGVSGPFRKEYCIRPNDRAPETSWYRESKERFKRLMERRSYIQTEWSSHSRRAFLSIIKEGDYDVILCRYIHDTYPMFGLPAVLKRKIVIDFDDIYSEEYFSRQRENITGSYHGFKWAIQERFIIRHQGKCLTFGASLFCSEQDRNKIAKGDSRGNAYVVPNTYPAMMSFPDESLDGYQNIDTLLFVGALDYGPNISGLRWFVEEIFSRINHGAGAGMHLVVVGRHPVQEIRELCGNTPNVELHADVPEIRTFYQACGVVVVPILSGGGTRIKILESGLAGRPVISTPFGASGLDVRDGKDLFFFHDKTSFLEKHGILKEEARYRAVVSSFRKIIEDKYSPKNFEKTMVEVLNNVLSKYR